MLKILTRFFKSVLFSGISKEKVNLIITGLRFLPETKDAKDNSKKRFKATIILQVWGGEEIKELQLTILEEVGLDKILYEAHTYALNYVEKLLNVCKTDFKIEINLRDLRNAAAIRNS